MPRPRSRFNEQGEPNPLRVTLDDKLAGPLYSVFEQRGFKDETELVRHIVREWLRAEGLLGRPVEKPAS